MSAAGPVPPAGASRPLRPLALVILTIATVAAAGILILTRSDPTWEVAFAAAPHNDRVAFAMQRTCTSGSCQTLWIGESRRKAEKVATLADGASRCDEIAWLNDGKRVGFLIDGYQLRIYDAETLGPAGQMNLVEPIGEPSSRVARGVTFSENGKAVTFDDCPRFHSGCRAGIAAVPQPAPSGSH